jgi:hypothetical protein
MEVLVTGFVMEGEGLRVWFESAYGVGSSVDWQPQRVEVGKRYTVQWHMCDDFVFGETLVLSKEKEMKLEIAGERFRVVTQVEDFYEENELYVRVLGAVTMIGMKDASMIKAGDWVAFEGKLLVLYPSE